MRRMTSTLLSLAAVLTASTLAAPAAGAAPRTDRPAPASGVPAGWERAGADDLAHLAGAIGSGARADETTNLALKSVRNGKFAAAEINYAAPNTGVLRARSPYPTGAWEGFAFEWDEATQTFALKSLANNLYVAVEKNFTGNAKNALRARSTTAGGWERFELYQNEELNLYALRSTLNDLFVAMENSYTGPLQYTLRARSAEVTGSWEQFDLYSIDG